MRATLPLIALLCCQAVLAQAPAPSPAQTPRVERRIERIHIEDGGTKVDEVRYGGETQSVTVQPKLDVPPYEIQPTDGARSRPASRDGSGTPTGQRVWNVLNF
ncbi:MAG: hypothetical protein ACRECD_10235 [Burkholderiaceae bacterium]